MPARVRVAALVLCLVPSAAAQEVVDQFGQTVPAELAAKVDEARELRLPYNTETYDAETSARLLEEVVDEKADYYRAWFNLGLALGQLDRYDEANAAFDQAIAIMDSEGIEDISIFNSAGWVNLNAGRFDRAEALLRRGLEMEELGSEATVRAMYNNLGLLYFYTQRFTEAEEALSIAEEMGSTSATDTLEVIRGARTRAFQLQRESD